MENKRKKFIRNDIAQTVGQNKQFLTIRDVNPKELEELTRDTMTLISLNVISFSWKNYCSYIGQRKICRELKKQLGGKVIRQGYCYAWMGEDSQRKAQSIVNSFFS